MSLSDVLLAKSLCGMPVVEITIPYNLAMGTLTEEEQEQMQRVAGKLFILRVVVDGQGIVMVGIPSFQMSSDAIEYYVTYEGVTLRIFNATGLWGWALG